MHLAAKNIGQIVQAYGGVGMLRAKSALANGQGFFIERARSSVLPLVFKQQSQIIEHQRYARMLATLRGFVQRQRTAIKRFSLCVMRPRPVDPGKVAERGGDVPAIVARSLFPSCKAFLEQGS